MDNIEEILRLKQFDQNVFRAIQDEILSMKISPSDIDRLIDKEFSDIKET